MKHVNREKGTSPCFRTSACQPRMGSVNLLDSDKAAAESVAPLGWQDFIKPQLFQKGKLPALVHLSAPPQICCLHPNRDIGTQDSWAVRDPANLDLSRWTCERLQFSKGWLEEDIDVLSGLSCCHRGVSKLSATLPVVWICNLFNVLCVVWGLSH